MSEAIKNKTYHYEEEQEVEIFFQVPRGFPKIRKAQVERAMIAGEYDLAICLCEESEQMDSKYAGLGYDWRVLRFGAYKHAGRTTDINSLAYTLASSGEEECYRLLKELVNAEEWPKTLASLLAVLRKLNGLHLFTSPFSLTKRE